MSKEFKGTKGEWNFENGRIFGVQDNGGFAFHAFVADAGFDSVFNNETAINNNLTPEVDLKREEVIANMKLIAAAPDLLEALRQIMKEVNDPVISRGYINNVCNKAISKALD
jgi:hypothetical protein